MRSSKGEAKTNSVCYILIFPKWYRELVCLDAYLKNFVIMNPNKSVYAFGLNRKKPGHFNLAFLANRTAPIQTWVSKEVVFFSFACGLIVSLVQTAGASFQRVLLLVRHASPNSPKLMRCLQVQVSQYLVSSFLPS
jgi:SH2 domain